MIVFLAERPITHMQLFMLKIRTSLDYRLVFYVQVHFGYKSERSDFTK